MSSIICLSSDDDDDDEVMEKKTQKNKKHDKRKLSLSLSSIAAKKRKLDDTKIKSDKEKNVPSHLDFLKPETSRQSDTSSMFPKKIEDSEQHSITKIKPKLIVKEKVSIPDPSENIFEEFINTCKKRKNDDVTQRILCNLQKRYDQLEDNYQKDEDFRLFLRQNLQKVSNGHNEKFYSYIQDVHNEIKRRIKKPKKSKVEEVDPKHDSRIKDFNAEIETKCTNLNISKDEDTSNDEEVFENSSSKKNSMRVKKLEKAISKCKKKIKELEEREVNFSDEENSAYLQEDRYKKKLVQLCQLYSDMAGDKMLKNEIFKKQLQRKDIPDEMTGIPQLDDTLINIVNKSIKNMNKLKHIKFPNANPDFLKVPDYPEILQSIKNYNDEKNLKLSTSKMESLAKNAFKSLGNYLKKKRNRESEQYLSSFIEVDAEKDPATKNPELLEKLKKNKKEGDEKLNEIFKKYVDKQEGLSNDELERQKNVNSDFSDNDEDNNSKKQKIEECIVNCIKIKDQNKTNLESPTVDSLDDGSVETNREQNHKNKIENLMKKPSDSRECKNENITTQKSSEQQKKKTEKDIVVNKKNENTNFLFELAESEKKVDSCIGKVQILDKNSDKEIVKHLISHTEISNSDLVTEAQIDKTSNTLISSNEFQSLSETNSKRVSTDKNKTNITLENKTKTNEDIQTLCNTDLAIKKNVGVLSNKKKDKNSMEKLTEVENSLEDVIEIFEGPERTNKKHQELKTYSHNLKPNLKADINKDKKSSFIKVKSFAKSPASWKDNSPEKLKYDPKILPKVSQCIDLTDDKDEQSCASMKKKYSNPKSFNKQPAKNVFVVKNVVNNYSVTYPPNSNNCKDRPSNIFPSKQLKINNPLEGKRVTITKSPSAFIKKVSLRDHENGPDLVSTSIISGRPFLETSKDKS